jgi:hypothetical protein
VFVEACKAARAFTRPIVISIQRCDNTCESSIGAFVVVNEDGWAVTAGHIVEMVKTFDDQALEVNQLEEAIAALEARTDLVVKEKKKLRSKLARPNANAVRRHSELWGWSSVEVEGFHMLKGVDLAVFQLKGFKPEMIKQYPVFKDPARDFLPGTSLCKHGFPFHSIPPTFDSATNQFALPEGAFPPPFFPIEGIYTRMVTIPSAPGSQKIDYNMSYIETSSPGLKGQSGGPITDQRGSIWAIQSQTKPLPLGFSPQVIANGSKVTEHQFLNVGLGVHAETVVGFLRELKVDFKLSDY